MTMGTIDAIDAAFTRRWRDQPPPAAAAAVPATAAVPEAPPTAAAPARGHPFVPAAAAAPWAVARLLAEATPQWEAIADRVEAARQRGRRIIAVAGHAAAEGRTTIVTALARVLAARGRDAVAVTPDELPHVGGSSHDRRIVLVDAGIWFPPGPIRRPRLLVMSHGCEAVILVRRADQAPMAAAATVLAGLGIEPLGEVLTFVPTTASPTTEAER